jgi:lysophospholipase L1-like esterase
MMDLATLSSPPQLPKFTPNTPSYNDEGTGTSGWTNTNSTISQPDATTVRITQITTGVPSSISRATTQPIANKDFILYGKVRARASAGDATVVQIIGTTNLRLNVYLNFNSITTTTQVGTISLQYRNAAGTNYNEVAATGIDTQTNWVDFAMCFNRTFDTLSLHFREAGGTWKFGCHVLGSSFNGDLALTTNNSSVSGVWAEFDFFTLVSPDLLSIGDSYCSGATLYGPQQSQSFDNGDSSWQRWCAAYPNNRNTLILNKGVGGNTSAQVATRINADAISHGPKVVFLGVTANDLGAGTTLAQRTTNIQTSLTALNNAGIKPVMWNTGYLAAAFANNPAGRILFETWWREYRCTLTGLKHCIDIMVPVQDATGYIDPAYVQADNVHLNVVGYTRVGKYMAGKKYT